jgi:hypothetical protein
LRTRSAPRAYAPPPLTRQRSARVRGYEDDDEPDQRPQGELFDSTLPIWRAAEALLHASRMAANLGVPDAAVQLRGVWTGFRGRRLASWGQPRRFLAGSYVALQDSIQREVAMFAPDIQSNLPTAVYELLRDVYALFDFFDLPFGLVEEEVKEFLSAGIR